MRLTPKAENPVKVGVRRRSVALRSMGTAATQKLIFASSVEALLKAAQGNIKVETEKKLGELRMGFSRPVDPAYPAESWASAVRLIAADLFPQESYEDQHRMLGGKTVRQFADTFMGKAMFAAAKVLG